MTIAVFHPLAEQELLDAASYYKEQRPGFGLQYLEEIKHSVNFLIRYPYVGTTVRGSIRRLVLPRFPYSLLYRVLEDDCIRILAIAHHKRRPQYWLSRE